MMYHAKILAALAALPSQVIIVGRENITTEPSVSQAQLAVHMPKKIRVPMSSPVATRKKAAVCQKGK